MIPLYGYMQGDSLVLLILTNQDETIAELGEKLQASASVRVAPISNWKIIFKNRELNPEMKVGDANMTPLDSFTLVKM